ncbi:MAG TPA: flagellar basal body L-ring protein FlgH [Steroidobacteraceae bacterium]
MSLQRITFVSLLAFLHGACAVQEPLEDYDPVWPEEPVSAPGNGAIYQAGRDVALFENATARNVGDIVTIRLVERTNASKSSSTTTSKSTSIDLPGPTIAGRPVTINGTQILNNSMESQQSFDGSGDSSQSNRLEGYITAAVVKRLPNGNLFVRGQKWIGINQGKEYVRVEGVIRSIDIEPDNSIPSYKVANATLSYGGRGALADANRQSWLARFFNSPLMPF